MELTIADNTILVATQGQWNSESLNNLHQALSPAVTKTEQRNLGVLLTPKGEAVSVEASLKYHINGILHSKTKVAAVNLAHFTRSQLSENLFNKIYRAAGIKYAFFDNIFETRVWLEKQLKSVKTVA